MAYPYSFNPYPYYPQPMPSMEQMRAVQPQQTVPQPQPVQQPTQGLSQASRPVGNREEANSVPADFSGAPMVFPDFANDKVYVKRWNMQTGVADFIEYARVDAPVAPAKPEAPAFATLDDVKALHDEIDRLNDEIEKLRKPVAKKEVKKNGTDDE